MAVMQRQDKLKISRETVSLKEHQPSLTKNRNLIETLLKCKPLQLNQIDKG